MAVLHYDGLIAAFLTASGGSVRSGVEATVWTAKSGGTQLLDIVDEYGGTGGKIRTGPDGRFAFEVTFPDGSEQAVVWIDLGVGQRWSFHCLETAIASSSGLLPVITGERPFLMGIGGEAVWTNPLPEDVGAAPADAIETHEEALNPHPQYIRFANLTTAVGFWSVPSGDPFPSSAPDGDYMIYG